MKRKSGTYLIKLHKRNKQKKHRRWLEEQIKNGKLYTAIHKAMNGYS